MANNGIVPKYNEKHPTVLSIRRYEKEIEELETKYAQANEAQDWSMRNWYYNQMEAKKKNMALLKEKLGSKRIVYTTDD